MQYDNFIDVAFSFLGGLYQRWEEEYSVCHTWFSLNWSLYPRSACFHVPLPPCKIMKGIFFWLSALELAARTRPVCHFAIFRSLAKAPKKNPLLVISPGARSSSVMRSFCASFAFHGGPIYLFGRPSNFPDNITDYDSWSEGSRHQDSVSKHMIALKTHITRTEA